MSDPAEVPIRDAATIALLRNGGGGMETYLLTRIQRMVFAGGVSVFPGGRVDDGDADLPFTGEGIARAVQRFDVPEHVARLLVGAAVRETFEECGAALVAPSDVAPKLAEARAAVEAGGVAFGDLLRGNGVSVDSAALYPWARWVTPLGEVRRYDTRFFISAVPSAIEGLTVSAEASAGAWVPVGEALEQAQRGERVMLPPTMATLASLLPFDSVDEAIAAAGTRPLEAIRPTLTIDEGRVYARMPDGTEVEIPASMLKRASTEEAPTHDAPAL